MEAPIAALEQRIERLLGATEPDPREEAGHLTGIEQALLEALHTQPDADRGHPVLSDAAAWRDLADRSGARAAAETTDEFLARLIRTKADAWKAELVESDDPDACFRDMAAARALDLEALTRRKMASPLADTQPLLRERFTKALAARPPTGAQRRAWVTELVDRADVVLTGIDDVEPHRARALIRRVVTDLQWHLENVEPQHATHRMRLKRKIRRLRAEGQERDLQYRLEKRFGRTFVGRFERLILFLIVLVLGILTAEEVFFDFSKRTKLILSIVDLGACLIFLTEFFVKLSMVHRKRNWFARHFLVDFLPSIPFAFMLRWARALRFLRFLRVARYVRFLQPIIRVFRAFGFVTRGTDRIVRKYGALLNTNIVLYPTREERDAMTRRAEDLSSRLRRLQARINERWERLLTTAPRDARESVVLLRLNGLERALENGWLRDRRAQAAVAPADGDLAAGTVLQKLATLTPQQLEAETGQDFVARIARGVRLFSLPPLRWLPVVRRYVPRLAPGMDDPDVVTAASHKTARELKRHYDRYFWFADLHGTVTPAQFVDRVGSAMVKWAKRPAVRLILFGALFLLLQFFLGRSDVGMLAQLHQWLGNVIGTFLKVVGTICFLILALGWWLRRVAGQATDFFTQSARAQYIGLTESIKGRHVDRDAEILNRRVFQPEQITRGLEPSASERERFAGSVRSWLVESQVAAEREPGFDPVERALWIYRDSLDGALFGANDSHTTSQLLGNPALRNLRLLAARFTRRDQKRLIKLDLERQKSLVRGPYLWFSLICKSVEHGVARLLVDYNRNALPLDQLASASHEERRIYEAWLDTKSAADVPSGQVLYVTNEFTALHFLDAHPERDRDIEARFGPEVLVRLRRDRRYLVRRIFGMYPLHKRPRGERVLNLYRVYHRWLAGGRALLIPFRVVGNWVRFCGRFVTWLARCVREIRHPQFTVDVAAVEGADFDTALRKIQRMRGPVALAALRLRARFDPEYLGLRLPQTERSGLEELGVDEDIEFLRADPDLAREVGEERLRASRDMVRLSRLIRDGLWERIGSHLGMDAGEFGREHLRAAAAAYVGDVNQVRRFLSAPEILAAGYERAARDPLLPRGFWPRPQLKLAFTRWWAAHGEGDRAARRAAWRATVHDVDGLRGALEAWAEAGGGATSVGEAILAEILRHPGRMTEQLVTLRTVQTLSMIDMLNYREHVYLLGEYAASGDDPGGALSLA